MCASGRKISAAADANWGNQTARRRPVAFRITFTEPDNAGNQPMCVLRADGAAARHGTEGTLLGEGHTGEVFPLGVGGLAWAGLAADPFTADGIALGLQRGSTTPLSSRPHRAISSPAVM